MSLHPQLVVEEADEELTKDTIFTVLSNERRRRVLAVLRDTSEGSDIGELSRQLAAWENDVAVDQVTYKQRKRVYTSLHQTHLPKLADVGVVDYDRDRGTVAIDERATRLEAFLTDHAEETDPWPVVYLAVGVAGILVAAGAVAGVLPQAVPDVALAATLAVVLSALATVHAYLAGVHDRLPTGDA